MQFKSQSAQRTAARRQGHRARIERRWEGHVPPFEIWRESETGESKCGKSTGAAVNLSPNTFGKGNTGRTGRLLGNG